MQTTTPRTTDRRWLRYAALAAIVLAVIGGIVASIDVVSSDTESGSLHFEEPIDRIELHIDNGDVEIVGSDESTVTIDVVTRGGLHSPQRRESVVDGTLTIDSDCGFNLFSPTCSIDYVIHVPRAVALEARGSGTDYHMHGISGVVDISLSGGDSDLRFAEPANLVRARSNGGDIDITVPAGIAHHIDVGASGGTTRVDIPTDPDSPYVIDAHSNGGDVVIGQEP